MGFTPRATYRVLSFDERGRGTAGDETYNAFTFMSEPGTIDVGDVISGEPNIPDATFLEDIIIEKGRNALTERPWIISEGLGITSTNKFGEANQDPPSDRTRNPENIRRKP